LFFSFPVPAAPRLLMALNAKYTTVTLSWIAPNPSNGIITGYQLEYGTNNDSSLVSLPSNDELTHTVTGLSSNTEYQFRVAAITVVGRGPYSDIVTQNTTSEFYRFSTVYV